jgi:hypothetical protein
MALSGSSSSEKLSRDMMLVSAGLAPSGDTLPSLAEASFYSPPSDGRIWS